MFWLLAAAAVVGLIASSSGGAARSDSSAGRLLLLPGREPGPALPPRPKYPPEPAEIVVDPPSESSSFAVFVAVALVVGLLTAGWLTYSGAFGLSVPQIALATGLAAVLNGVIAGWAVWLYQCRLHDRARAFATSTYNEDLRIWEEDCQRIDEEYRARVEQVEAGWRAQQVTLARLAAEERSREMAAREHARLQELEESARREREARAAELRRSAELAKQEAAETVRVRTARVRTALAWWVTERPHLDERARAFWTDIIGQAAHYRTRYDDPSDPCATAERCHELAAWAVDTIPAEIGHFLADGPPSIPLLASILRQHHGHEIEELLPRARACQRAERLRPAPEPPGMPAAESPFVDLLADLPPAMRSELSKNIHAVIHVDEVRAIAAKILEHRKHQLEAEGVAHDVIDERLAALDQNLGRATREFARKRGLV